MVAPNSARPSRETQCPECGHTIKSAAAGRGKRVQCPKCRAAIDLAAPEAAPAGERPAPRPDTTDVAALLARLEGLEDRVRTLEAQGPPRPGETPSAPAPVAAAPPPDALAVTPAKLRWVAPAADALPAEGFAPETEAALLHNLSAFPARTITLGSPAGDVGAHARAERLRKIFERARWAVEGPHEAAPPGARRGLSLFVGALPASRNASATYFAFTAAGFALTSMIDPALRGDDALLFVA